ncbi:MAG: HupE/UreJ family protein [Cyanobacteria bacterium J06628_6]
MLRLPTYLARIVQRCSFALVVALVTIGLHSPLAAAHWADLSVADVVIGETSAQMTLTVPTAVVRFADQDGNDEISPNEFSINRAELTALFQESVVLFDPEQPLEEMSVNLQTQPNTDQTAAHTAFFVQYRWGLPVERLQMRYDLFPANAADAQCLVTVAWQDSVQNIIFRPGGDAAALTSARQPAQQFLSFMKLGAEHMFTGYDHVLFLVVLLLPGGGLFYQLKLVSTFALAHSLTLALGGLGMVSLPAVWVESAIALSIIYIAIDNLWPGRLQYRWAITFVFGLIHGLGFANMLQDLIAPRTNPLWPLVGFNLGIEVGQLAIVLLFLAGIRLFKTQSVLHSITQNRVLWWALSLGIAAVGTAWFTERALAAWL